MGLILSDRGQDGYPHLFFQKRKLLKKRLPLLCSIAAHRIKWEEKKACEPGCGLRSGIEEAGIDFDRLIGTSHMLIERPQVPLARGRKPPFSASRNFL